VGARSACTADVIGSNQHAPAGPPTPPAPGAPQPLSEVLAVLSLVATMVGLLRGADPVHVILLLMGVAVALLGHRVRRDTTCKHPRLWTLALLAGVAMCVVVLLSTPAKPDAPPRESTPRKQPAPADHVVHVGKPINVGLGPDQLAVAGDELWISTTSNVARIDSRHDGAPRVGLSVAGAYDIAGSGRRIVVVRHGHASRFDTSTRRRIGKSIAFSEGPGHVAAGFGAAWICNRTHWKLDRWDLATGAFRPIPLPGIPVDVVVGGGAVWVSLQSGVVVRVDPETNEVNQISTEQGPGPMAFGLGKLWVAHPRLRVVTRIDPARLEKVGRNVKVGPDVRALTVLRGSVWAVSAGADQVQRIDPGTARVADRYKVGAEPRDVVTLGGRLFVSSANESTITPIDVRTPPARRVGSRSGAPRAEQAEADALREDPWPERRGALPGWGDVHDMP
jgi:hypothetical protein